MSEAKAAVARQDDAVREAVPEYLGQTDEINREDVPHGYKRTEIGVIPEDWKLEFLARISEFITKGSTPTTYGFKWVEDGYLFLRSECVSENGLDLSQSMLISEEAHRFLHRSEVRDGDILITITGNVGRVIFLSDVGQANINQHIARIRIREKNVNSKYVFHYLSDVKVKNYFEKITTGQAYPQISLEQVRNAIIPLPNKNEQRAIAAALSDADALIESLERLIAKKRAIKQAAMQQLLTCQTRLPGFEGEWETKRLGDVANVKTGGRNNEDKVEDGLYPFFVRSEYVERIDSYSYDCEAIVIPGEGKIGEIFHYVNGRFDLHQRVYAITKFTRDVSARFIYFYMAHYFGAWAMQNTVKATVDSLRLPTFLKFEINLPKTKAEQDEIATILTDLDMELEALEHRRDKAHQIKQGMMQQLLTGRVRLVKPEAYEAAAC